MIETCQRRVQRCLEKYYRHSGGCEGEIEDSDRWQQEEQESE